MSQEILLDKKALVTTLGILLDLKPAAQKDLSNLNKDTLQEMYDNYIVNAKAANHDAFKKSQ